MHATIIIGAGAAGLIAARRLSAAGHAVILLEAAPIAGGRIYTVAPGGSAGFTHAAEGGAEFIHGELPLSLQLAKEAGVSLQPVAAQMVRMQSGKPTPPKQRKKMSKDWAAMMQRMAALAEDQAFGEFLEEWFPGERYRELRSSAGRMAQGYDLADLHRVSTRWLYREWSEEADEEEFRPEGGYGRLIGWLADVCRSQGCLIHFSTAVTAVRWQRGSVEAIASDGRVFRGSRLITTVSLGVLRSGAIEFFPALPVQQEAIRKLGFGSVIKVLLEFNEPFWRDRKRDGQTLFIVSGEAAPTWWTQPADDHPLITGWIPGGAIQPFRSMNSEGRIERCLGSLANIFSRDVSALGKALKASLILDWETAPFIRGGYSFETVGGGRDRSALAEPVEGTLYFAGEALYDGPAPGTVEAAFSSGVAVAGKITG
ncbi:MAG TPA: NAD(P)/FAD-dependent oxidoreductase [Puia sp.]|jgi:monoamine oxidase|nr:NAD(P)/FAD-dependent oxidoreductase [Puia sp.]